MAGGLFALLDDVALIARKAAVATREVASSAASTSSKAAAVVVDDAAVAPGFVEGVTPARELPIVWKITKGSLVNKIVIILPIALLLSWLAPWALTPILMVGGTYLSFEGAEKIWHAVAARRGGHGHGDHDDSAADSSPGDEASLVKGAVMTDLILSAEIMVISLNEVTDKPFLERSAILIVVALVITVGVYGVVGMLVKMDDIGLRLAVGDAGRTGLIQKAGRAMVAGMPKILAILSVVGTAAMLWVGGHILTNGTDELGWHLPHEIVHDLEDVVASAGGAAQWLVETGCSAVVGFLVGSLVLVVVTVVVRLFDSSTQAP
jgi:predicted DNA repair protein MutK